VENGTIRLNPLAGHIFQQTPVKKRELPTREQLDNIIAKIPELFPRYGHRAALSVRFLAFSGMRISEATSIKWGDIRGGRIYVGESKTGERTLDINPLLQQTIDDIASIYGCPAEDLVIPAKNIRLQIQTACRELGYHHLDHHDLRAWFITWAINAGIDVKTIADWVGDKVIDQVASEANYRERRDSVNAFNKVNKRRKRGLALVPLKFGISFTATMLNQGGALLNIYMDGSVSVNHGGTEMGQGLNTKMAQVCADGLGIDLKLVRVTGTDTQKVPNASATSASSGADINGAAIMNATAQMRARLAPVVANMLGCKDTDVSFSNNMAHGGGKSVEWTAVAKQAWMDRVGLSVTGFYMTPEIKYDFATLTGHAFYYYCYGASVSEVEIDTRTGEYWIKAVDIVHDAGKSINPAIDKGQIEGGYVQGMGWLTMEECIWDKKGKFLTHGPSTYKIPVAGDIPEHFNVTLFDGSNLKPTPFYSKAVGEPPLMLALSTFFALRDAVSASADHKTVVHMSAPATPEKILMTCEKAKAAA
jgi:xanthine dehydrogenase molybdopterin-binding subunit B